MPDFYSRKKQNQSSVQASLRHHSPPFDFHRITSCKLTESKSQRDFKETAIFSCIGPVYALACDLKSVYKTRIMDWKEKKNQDLPINKQEMHFHFKNKISITVLFLFVVVLTTYFWNISRKKNVRKQSACRQLDRLQTHFIPLCVLFLCGQPLLVFVNLSTCHILRLCLILSSHCENTSFSPFVP